MALGIFFALLAALSLGGSQVLARRAMFHLPVSVTVVLSMLVIMVGVASMGLIIEGPSAFLGLPGEFFLWVALLAVFSYVTGQLLLFTALHYANVAIAAPIVAGHALFSLLFAVTLGGERPNLPTVLGAFVIVAGVTIILSDRNRLLR